jgi:hypothetical protein
VGANTSRICFKLHQTSAFDGKFDAFEMNDNFVRKEEKRRKESMELLIVTQ